MYFIISFLLRKNNNIIAIEQIEFKSDYYPQRQALLNHLRNDHIPNNYPDIEFDNIIIIGITKMSAAEYQQYNNPLTIAHKS